MAKNSITDYSKTASLNTDIQSVDIDEGCLPSGINNSIRELMADLAAVNDGTVSLTSPSFSSVNIDAGTIDGTVIGGTTPAAGTFTSGTFTGDVSFGDNDKAIFGAGSDLQIYHDGSDSYINDSGVGDLKLGGNQLQLNNAAQTKNYIYAVDGAQVELKYNNALKLATTATGVDVTGTVTADGLTVQNSGATYLSVGSTGGSGAILILDGSSNGDFAGGDYSTIRNTSTKLQIIGGTPNAPIELQTHDGSGNKLRQTIASNGDISFYEDTGTTPKFFWDASAESLGLGTSSPSAKLDLVLPSPAASASSGGIEITEGTKTFAISTTGSSYSYSGVGANELWYYGNSNFGAFTFGSDGAVPIKFISNGAERLRITSAGLVGIGTTSPSAQFHSYINTGASTILGRFENVNGEALVEIKSQNDALGILQFADSEDGNVGAVQYSHADNSMRFKSNDAERLRIDSSGNVLVGTTTVGFSSESIVLRERGEAYITADGLAPLLVNRLTSDGAIVSFRKNGTQVGSIGVDNSDNLYIQGTSIAGGLQFGDGGGGGNVLPHKNGADVDNTIDLGSTSRRFDDIYATNGTIQTSDANEKQQIASLTDAEITAAKAISKLFKTFKWNDKVEAKGDAARTHTGVIAQDVQQAMTGAGLDAGDYAFFISSTWWETHTEVPAVEADEENGVEAKDAYTRTDTYDTAEEAPEGATERTRLGIRYPELLAFVGAATEQRLADIETRLTALEGN